MRVGVGLAPGTTLVGLAERFGGELLGASAHTPVARFRPLEHAGAGDLCPVLTARWLGRARGAAERGAALLVAAELSPRIERPAVLWVHAYASFAMAEVLAHATEVIDAPPRVAADAVIGPHVVLGPRVTIGRRVTIGAGSVIGAPGFGWASSPDGRTVRVPQLGGVLIEDDVHIGALCTVDAGTLVPTRVARGAKLDAQVHLGHNASVGEGTIIAAQSGLAGSVTVGRGVLIGGQVGIADHITVGDGARIAAKSGVIGDVPAGAVVAGYPAMPRARWLRGLAWLHRRAAP